ncbi:hypothetical protein C8R45DRAFT_997642 [Mycena sanguinolenta]|nr:hypothetical protein C8R45DRAFT_997642 [Mycena sanguinolenta]
MPRLGPVCILTRSAHARLGQENESRLCSVGAVPDILSGSIEEHDGPYDEVEISCDYLTG